MVVPVAAATAVMVGVTFSRIESSCHAIGLFNIFSDRRALTRANGSGKEEGTGGLKKRGGREGFPPPPHISNKSFGFCIVLTKHLPLRSINHTSYIIPQSALRSYSVDKWDLRTPPPPKKRNTYDSLSHPTYIPSPP